MSRNIVIIGNSGSAKECYSYVRDMALADARISFKGFLAFEGFAGDLKDLASLCLGNDDSYLPAAGDEFVIGVGQPQLRERIYRKWKARGVSFMNLVDPTCSFASQVELGEANVFGSATRISQHVVIGNNNYFNGDILVSHDVTIGDSNTFGPSTILLGNVSIGSANSFGVNSVVMPKARIGSNNTFAPGAYIYKGCKDDCLMAGNPALKVK